MTLTGPVLSSEGGDEALVLQQGVLASASAEQVVDDKEPDTLVSVELEGRISEVRATRILADLVDDAYMDDGDTQPYPDFQLPDLLEDGLDDDTYVSVHAHGS